VQWNIFNNNKVTRISVRAQTPKIFDRGARAGSSILGSAVEISSRVLSGASPFGLPATAAVVTGGRHRPPVNALERKA